MRGENIPEHARIIGVADTYDAMASNRSYRNALAQDVIRSELVNGRGTQFDPQIADIMIQMVDEDTEYQMRQSEDLQKTILVVDDEIINIRLVTSIFRDQSVYRLISAKSGEKALEILQSHAVDLVLLDIEMPGMDGFETLKQIKERYDIPVVFMTATKQLAAINRAREMGVEDYITKPFMPQILLETVHGALDWENKEGL